MLTNTNLHQTPNSRSAQMNNAAKDDCLSLGSGTFQIGDLSNQWLVNDPGSAQFYGVRGDGVTLTNGVLTVADGVQSFEYGIRLANGTYSWATVHVAQPSGPELVSNGSFEQSDSAFLLTPGAEWQGYSQLPGWVNLNGNQLEDVTSGYSGIVGTNGTHWLDSQDTPAPIDISQVLGLQVGQAARMTFSVAAEDIFAANLTTSPDERLDFMFGGQVVNELSLADFTGSSGTVYNAFKDFSATIIGGSGNGSNSLEIYSHGSSSNVGFAIDDVSVKALICCPNV